MSHRMCFRHAAAVALVAMLGFALEGAMKDATAYANDIAKKENEAALEGIRKFGRSEIVTLSDAQKSAWKKAMVPVHKENESRVGRDTIEAVYKAVDFKP